MNSLLKRVHYNLQYETNNLSIAFMCTVRDGIIEIKKLYSMKYRI